MTGNRWQHVKAVLQAALEQDPDKRAAFVLETCGDDAALRAEVESLLAAHERAGSFAERPPLATAASMSASGAIPKLQRGDAFGAYVIGEWLGAGGMGEVYRARDTKLNREVALKVLPAAFALDPERVARFEREAQLLASLNHPNVGAIYGLEEANGIKGLVLELVEGPTLADRIAQGPMPIAEALPLAKQMADALEAAHEVGVIHRDLKPANVKVKDDGTVKVLDFGLAKALEPAALSPNLTQSPTMISPAMTERGVILGTAAYMSPEQAKGRDADKRSDVWSFGCVLYEMLTGRRAFEGDDVSDTLAAVLRGEPDWSALAANAPPAVVVLIKRCLQKDRRARIGGMSAAQFALSETDLVVSAGRASGMSKGRVFARHPAVAAAVLLLAGAAAAVIGRRVIQQPVATSEPVVRFAIPLEPNQRFSTGGGFHLLALSPQGTHLVYNANNEVYLRPLDSLEAIPMRGIEGRGINSPRATSFSPDGQWIGFYQAGYLKRASVNGGAPVVISKGDLPFGVSWGEDDTIVFGAGADGIWRVRSDGGEPENLIKVDPGQYAQGPQVLPGGRRLVFTLLTDRSGSFEQPGRSEREVGQPPPLVWDDANVVVQSLDTGERRVLIEGASDARYVPSGHLVFASRGSIFAVPFDAANATVTGGRVTVAENVAYSTQTGAAHFTVSRTGSFAYVPGTFSSLSRTMAWVDRQGRETPINAPARGYMYPRVSPDGTRVAVTIEDANQQDVWIWDLSGERLTRLTSHPADDRYSEWTPDGRYIIFASRRGGSAGLWRQPADGGLAERLVDLPDPRNDWLLPSKVSSDGARMVPTLLARPDQDSPLLRQGANLHVLTLGPEPHLAPLLQTAFSERSAEISPDGRWIAYQSTESGQFEIYVRRADDVNKDERWRVSSGGGQHALWAPNSRELFYAEPGGGLMRVAVEGGGEWKASKPMALVDGPYTWTLAGFGGRLYDISRDGQRFLALKPVESETPRTIVVVQNWTEELKRLVPAR